MPDTETMDQLERTVGLVHDIVGPDFLGTYLSRRVDIVLA